ncbi:MAG: bifunctional diaminohydroxyphosphoribosylaminopyrimidine deaminase/5-amino-6-(5-phosphoribosylamino)uracil reductase RibD [Lachnospiraceae bacterium]|nr:bifunctional diaminohydroxyphosphoribosylaminopyrimidine deaminase/5-amino-6-(5-phosphoribosylamino)uracil reductase RibD [Lachnospiraceae bacterium]
MTDQDYMRRAIALAWKGAGWTNPNPMVGAVIVKSGRIIGEGYHPRCGEYHAERIALSSCTEDPAGGTAYVTLEPCCHYGRTPPCTEILLEKKIARVVIGSRDPNPKVAGKGARVLREHGVKVEEDFLREECDELNPVFFHYITTGRPYVVMKYAMTLDGKIATHTGASKWITGEKAREHVHQLRGRYAVVMAGAGTVLADDPMLNCRISGGHQPVRVICDSQLRIPENSQICQTAADYPTIVACAEAKKEKKEKLESLGITVLTLPDPSGRVDLHSLVEQLGKRGLDSVLVEGGGTLHEAALRSGIVNHICAYIAPKVFGGQMAKTPVEGMGVSLPEEGACLERMKMTLLGEDVLLEYDIAGGMNGVYWNC